MRQEAGGRRQEVGGRRQEAGGRRQETGGTRQKASCSDTMTASTRSLFCDLTNMRVCLSGTSVLVGSDIALQYPNHDSVLYHQAKYSTKRAKA